MIEGDFENKKKCMKCGKQATKLCDIVTGTAGWAGHPPRYLTQGVHNPEVKMGWNLTCDNPICEKCSAHLSEHMDICPTCINKIKKIAKLKEC